MNVNSKLPAQQTIKQWLATATESLRNVGIPSAKLDAELITSHVLGVERTWLISHRDDLLETQSQADALLKERLARIPLAYLLGVKEFYGRSFCVNHHVLIPRPESETLIDLYKELPLPRKSRAIDVGTGSGALAITMKLERSDIDVYAIDIDEEALAVTTDNAKRLSAHLTFSHSDLLRNFSRGSQVVSCIVANLPYVDTSWERSPETDHEPALALFASDGGLAFIKRLVIEAQALLAPRGFLLLEADPDQHMRIIDFSNKHGFALYEQKLYALSLRKV